MSSYVSTEYDYVTGVNRKKQWQLVIVVDSLIQRQIKQSDHMSACTAPHNKTCAYFFWF